MNGRVYDYNVGRFMSVDPFIQAPGNRQSLNPYSYVMNNPLSGTDPTGYAFERKVKVTSSHIGSRVKRSSTVTVSGKDNGKGGGTVTVSGGNGAARGAVIGAITGKLASAGFKTTDIGSPKEVAQNKGSNLNASNLMAANSQVGVPSPAASPGATSISPDGEKFIQSWEAVNGPDLQSYPDSAGHETIGYGHKLTAAEIKSGKFKNGITKKEALQLFRKDAQVVNSAINRLVKAPLSQEQFDATASLIFNIGVSRFAGYNIRKQMSAGNYKAAYSEFANINKVRDPSTGQLKFSGGLDRRRRAEMKLFKVGVYENNK